jgi:Flp pilus assembly protein TadD
MDEYEKARKYYESALDIEYDTYAVLGLALLNRTEGRIDLAIQSLKRLVAHEPKNTRIYMELAHTYLQDRDERNAMMVLRDFFDQGLQDRHATELYNRLKGPR